MDKLRNKCLVMQKSHPDRIAVTLGLRKRLRFTDKLVTISVIGRPARGTGHWKVKIKGTECDKQFKIVTRLISYFSKRKRYECDIDTYQLVTFWWRHPFPHEFWPTDCGIWRKSHRTSLQPDDQRYSPRDPPQKNFSCTSQLKNYWLDVTRIRGTMLCMWPPW